MNFINKKLNQLVSIIIITFDKLNWEPFIYIQKKIKIEMKQENNKKKNKK